MDPILSVHGDALLRLHKEMVPKPNEQHELDSVLAKVKEKFSIGDYVHVKGTNYIGIITEWNTSLGGFYPGVRYPVHVMIVRTCGKDKHNAKGSTFEYDVDQLEKYVPKFYRINCGPLAVQDGAYNPLGNMFKLAEVMDAKVFTGHTWGQDFILVPIVAGTRQAVEELMTELKLIWEIEEGVPREISGVFIIAAED